MLTFFHYNHFNFGKYGFGWFGQIAKLKFKPDVELNKCTNLNQTYVCKVITTGHIGNVEMDV